jgi:hypothetical protein
LLRLNSPERWPPPFFFDGSFRAWTPRPKKSSFRIEDSCAVRTDKKGREQQSSRPFQVNYPLALLARTVAGSTAGRRAAAGCLRRLDRSGKAQSDHCQQHDCSHFLHGLHDFSPFEKSNVVVFVG